MEIKCNYNIETFAKRQQTIMDKLKILTDAAKYVAYTIALVFTGVLNKNYYTI